MRGESGLLRKYLLETNTVCALVSKFLLFQACIGNSMLTNLVLPHAPLHRICDTNSDSTILTCNQYGVHCNLHLAKILKEFQTNRNWMQDLIQLTPDKCFAKYCLLFPLWRAYAQMQPHHSKNLKGQNTHFFHFDEEGLKSKHESVILTRLVTALNICCRMLQLPFSPSCRYPICILNILVNEQ